MPLVTTSVQTDETDTLLEDTDAIDVSLRGGYRKHYEHKLGTTFASLKLLKAQQEGWMSRRTKKCLFMLVFLASFSCFGIFYFGFYCSETRSFCALTTSKSVNLLKFSKTDYIGKYLNIDTIPKHSPTFEEVVSKDFQFDIEDHDVIVFLHIQKTGGTTFGKHLVNDLELDRECRCHRRVKKRCTCLRPGRNSKETWLFSRLSTGWKCGLHADWTELTTCVDDVMNRMEDNIIQRRYFYITYLRDPVQRYLSEFRHVGRGATWSGARLFCNGRSATQTEVPRCWETHWNADEKYWDEVSLEEFMACESNLANNRQTRMMADLTLVNCYDTTKMLSKERDALMLASAKMNLHKMAFFGLTEIQQKSQYVFEETFNLRFNVKFEQFNSTRSLLSYDGLTDTQFQRIKAVNHLDVELYEYAKELLENRYAKLKSLDAHFSEHFDNMGNIAYFDPDKED